MEHSQMEMFDTLFEHDQSNEPIIKSEKFKNWADVSTFVDGWVRDKGEPNYLEIVLVSPNWEVYIEYLE